MTGNRSDRGTTDRKILYACSFVRATATGMIGVLMGITLSTLKLSPTQIGGVIAAGLAGGAAASALATFFGDRWGRRRMLIDLALFGAAGGILVAAASQPVILSIASFLGMLNGMGRDRGASVIIEQAILPATTSDHDRTRAFAVYNVLQDIGHAVGSLLAVLPALLQHQGHFPAATSHRIAILVYAALVGSTAVIYRRLSAVVEMAPSQTIHRIGSQTKKRLAVLSALFAVDSLAGGFVTTALLSFFFFQRFGVGEGTIGLLFFAARVANAGSHLAAAWLARRIGLVNTMVFTHIPSSIFLATVAFAPSFPVAVILFLLREGLVEMDVPTRQSYVMAVVRPEERTIAAGVTNLVRLLGWAAAPALAGLFMETVSLGTPLFIAAGMKIAYDVALYSSFRRMRPPEEAERR